MGWGNGDIGDSGGGSDWGNPIVGGTVLRIPAIESPGFVSGSTGWIIKSDGSAEFNNVVIRGSTTTQGVILLYNGTPAAGNLIVSIAPAAGTDAFGNAYPKGVQVSGGGANTILLNPSIPQIEINPDTTKYIAGYIGGSDGGTFGRLILNSPQNSVGQPGIARLLIESQASGGSPGPIFDFDQVGSTASPAGLAQFGVPIIVKSETWQTPSYGTNWATSTTFNGLTNLQQLQFRKKAEDEVELVGHWKAGGTLPANPVFTLPAGYRPGTQQLIPVVRNNAGAVTAGLLFVGTSGNISLFAGGGMGIAINNEYSVDATIPLGNIS